MESTNAGSALLLKNKNAIVYGAGGAIGGADFMRRYGAADVVSALHWPGGGNRALKSRV